MAEAEVARFAEHGDAGVVLRFGQFYGFDSGHTVEAINAVAAGLPAVWTHITTASPTRREQQDAQPHDR